MDLTYVLALNFWTGRSRWNEVTQKSESGFEHETDAAIDGAGSFITRELGVAH